MSNLFDNLFEISDSSDSLDNFLNENIQDIIEFCNSDYNNIVNCKQSIETFILLKCNIIDGLNYEETYNKAFISILLEFCERLNLRSSIISIYPIIDRNNLGVGSRLQAALLFLYNVDSNSTLINRFDEICQNLELAIEFEDDNEKKSITTFLNYYYCVIRDTYPHIKFASELKLKIEKALDNNIYQFLKHESIIQSLGVNYNNVDDIQKIIDTLLEKTIITHSVSDISKIIIETDTEYSNMLKDVAANFDSIRSISVRHAGSQKITGRGVKILESEVELYGYFKSYGNMHKAKLQSAFNALPSISSKINIIDWGCGQGFASMVFLEKYGHENINQITLIEPSEIALKRAALHCKKYCSKILLKTICKKLNDLDESDFNIPQSDITIHLFSNILDIDDYSLNRLINLIEKTLSKKDYFVCVSPYIDTIKTERLESFKRYFENKHTSSFQLLKEKLNGKVGTYWKCNNHNNPCYDHNQKITGYCSNKWTRVINVFSVN
ncbi:hypothetical protein D0T50_13155 [Bacteroides sp. 214]|uniref:class I SAM-dependent methyltransferase n=1 Tax=Bacteroides sp. 214 TaxID=2302935 RepID=UPI0013D07257|nr:hypothetical protein [Bacteroides sp. 214]NDW13829.1 hypothetical protein [Bacteroides sp. 214]